MFNMDGQNHTDVVGSFTASKDQDFRDGIKNLFESFSNQYRIDAVDNLMQILKTEALSEAYKENLLGDVIQESFNDPYMDLLPQKLEQLYENTSMELLESAYIGQYNPVVGVSLPILKKNFLTCHSKDIVMTEVPTKPLVKVNFERKFLKDKEGNKYYIPEIFYDETYRTVSDKTRGKNVTDKWYGATGAEATAVTVDSEAIRIQDLNVLEESGGSLSTRDSLGRDFGIVGVKMVVGSEVKELTVDIRQNFTANNTFTYTVEAKDETTDAVVKDLIVGQVDPYYGTVSVSCTGGKIVAIQFGGHLSNENNLESLEIDGEREALDWAIPEGEKFNTGITLEKIKDMKALFNRDVTADIISDMSTVATQFEDSNVIGFLDQSFEKWKNRKELPFGYKDGFVEVGEFSCQPPTGTFATPSQWISTELKFTINQLLNELKDKLKTKEVIFIAYGHPSNISLIQEDVNWVIDEGQKVGGVELDYRFGVMTPNGNRVHVISTLKVAKEKGIRFVLQPTTKDTITFKHYKYSFNIENSYRNPLTPLTPNVMVTSRYLTTEVLPIQGALELTNNSFGIK